MRHADLPPTACSVRLPDGASMLSARTRAPRTRTRTSSSAAAGNMLAVEGRGGKVQSHRENPPTNSGSSCGTDQKLCPGLHPPPAAHRSPLREHLSSG